MSDAFGNQDHHQSYGGAALEKQRVSEHFFKRTRHSDI